MESSDESKEGAIGHDIIGANKRDCWRWKAWTGVLWTEFDPLVVYDADVVAAGMHLVIDDNVAQGGAPTASSQRGPPRPAPPSAYSHRAPMP